MRFLLNLIDLPWWGALAAIGALVAFVYLSGVWFKWKINRIVHEAVVGAGAALKGAEATIHSVSLAPVPTGPSPYDLDADDENFDPDLDGTAWDEEGGHFYSIEATITPADPAAKWDPSALAVVPADFQPADPTDCCVQLGGLHSATVLANGRYEPLREGEIRGPKRLRMLFAIPEGVRAVKFASLVTYFGHVDLPAPKPAVRAER